jgi:hypothetical protein
LKPSTEVTDSAPGPRYQDPSGAGTGILRRLWSARRFARALLLYGGLILALQWAGGAYRAEFDGHPDEAAHFVTGLMVHDYLVARPHENPISWAAHYYLHYPKVAIGHWPPLFFLMEGLWWLIVPPSRWSAMLLNLGMGALAATLFERLISRRVAPGAPGSGLVRAHAVAAAVLLMIAPVTQQSFGLSMADLPGLLWAVLFLDACCTLLERPSRRALSIAGLWVICGLLTKGTAVCLAGALPLAFVLARKRPTVPWRWVWGTAAAVGVLGFGWYWLEARVLHHDLWQLGEIGNSWSLRMDLFTALAGPGLLALAGGGIALAMWLRRPAAVSAAAVLFSAVLASALIHAFSEPRHLILALPAGLLLAVEALLWLQIGTGPEIIPQTFPGPAATGSIVPRRVLQKGKGPLGLRRWALLAAVPALALFPFRLFRQQTPGFARLLAEIPHPGRMLISSGAEGEGGWIAEVALSERRPASVVVRASKALSREDWNGGDYRLLTPTPERVQTRLDELGIDTVIIYDEPGWKQAPHEALVEQTMAQDSAAAPPTWRLCAGEGALKAYCRAQPPHVPRQPLRIDLRTEIGRVIEE